MTFSSQVAWIALSGSVVENAAIDAVDRAELRGVPAQHVEAWRAQIRDMGGDGTQDRDGLVALALEADGWALDASGGNKGPVTQRANDYVDAKEKTVADYVEGVKTDVKEGAAEAGKEVKVYLAGGIVLVVALIVLSIFVRR